MINLEITSTVVGLVHLAAVGGTNQVASTSCCYNHAPNLPVFSGFIQAIGKLFRSPLDFLAGKSCSSICGSTWDLICYIENFCVANILKLIMVLVLSYIEWYGDAFHAGSHLGNFVALSSAISFKTSSESIDVDDDQGEEKE